MLVDARQAYDALDEQEQQLVAVALGELTAGVVPEGDIIPHPFYRRPNVARAQSMQVSPELSVLFISRVSRESATSIEHVILGYKRVRSYHAMDTRRDTRTDPSGAARRATGIAVRIAGHRRSHLRTEWGAILAGSPEDGLSFSSRRQFLLALGFLLAAVRMRVRDVAGPAWRPVDWLLRTASRTNGFVAAVVGAQAIYIVDDGGLSVLVTEVWEPCGIAGASLFALARWLRRVRGIELASPESERADE
ncbi:hypothetical protein U5640_29305 [Streptomyces sp. SS7]|uniref:hypothetical protein n=1 Tax=Streptomyces sp. SS7 TaxID=3108485 RepID=UPI0030EF093F